MYIAYIVGILGQYLQFYTKGKTHFVFKKKNVSVDY